MAAFRRARGVALLARWLGPWTRADAAPRGVERHVVREGASRCDVYRPARRAEGALLVVHGVHFHGPDDPRFERFARVLAGTGLVVVAPEVRSYRALMPGASAGEDIGVAAALTEREAVQLGTKPAGFSISFGCLGMLNAIAARDGGSGWAGVMPFGGFADWRATTRFAFTGRLDDGTAAPNDPLARPVMAIRLAEELAEEGVNVAEVQEAWRRFVHQTWCDEAMAEGDAWIEPARNIGSALAAPERGLYELGLGLRAEATEAIEAALSARDWSELDPRLAAGELSCPVYVAHGVGDQVIPVQEAPKLAAAAGRSSEVRCYVTRWFGHTGSGGFDGDAVQELSTMLGFLGALSGLPRTPR